MSRLILVDKPEGPTSHDIVSTLRRTLGVKKAGHCGTLDPMASGLLLVLTGWATRLAEVFRDHVKVYQGTVRFGRATDTDDRQGKTTAQVKDFQLELTDLDAALATLSARREQRPPRYAAIKQGGVPLYKLARAGKLEGAVLPLRPVQIHRLERLAWDGRDLELEIECSAGTYIRALARDLGEQLGVPAHLGRLRRLRSGPFRVEEAVSADRLLWEDSSDPLGLPVERALADLPAVQAVDDYAQRLRFGAQPAPGDLHWDEPLPPPGRWLRVLAPSGQLLALARVEEPGTAEGEPQLKLRRRLVD